MDFEWDPRKDAENTRKHGVSFRQATAFYDTLSLTIPDPEHSIGEERFVLLGMSNEGRLLAVCHADRGARLRIISARPASRVEVKAYEL
jgi:hypothetical protein